MQSRYYDPAASAALAWAASAITPLGTSTLTAGASGAFGGGSNVIRNTDLTTTFQAVCSTQATGGGAHLSHVGDFVVWARVYCPTGNTGDVDVALEWAEGDFRRFTRNASWAMDSSWEGTWRLVNLGQVHLSKVPQGTQRWEGRIVARSTAAGDEIDVNRLWIMPCTEGYGEARARLLVAAPTTFSARDEFNQSSGDLTGKTAPVGGTWAEAGPATGFTLDTTNKKAQRTTTSDASAHFATVPVTLSAVAVQADVAFSAAASASTLSEGVAARFGSTTSHVAAYIVTGNIATSGEFYVGLADGGLHAPVATATGLSLPVGTTYSVRLVIDALGRFWAWLFRAGSAPGGPLLAGYDARLATGGSLDDGHIGLYDFNSGPDAVTRTVDNFAVWVPVADAAVFASQSAELRHNEFIREDSAGTLWPEVSDYQGRYLFIPPAGQEGRTTRIVVKACRSDPDTMADHTAADDISARLTYIPRYLQVPEA